MTPKEKAKQLIIKFSKCLTYHGQLESELNQDAKDCALIAVNEILIISSTYAGKDYDYYYQVKQELEKI